MYIKNEKYKFPDNSRKKTLGFKFNFPFSINFVPYVEKLPITIKPGPAPKYGLDFDFK